jgi:pumilio RNA-binding family
MRLEKKIDAERSLLFDEILRKPREQVQKLMNDVFGNYVVQIMLDYGTSEQRIQIKEAIIEDIVSMSKDEYGCRVIQKLLSKLPLREQLSLLDTFKGRIMECVMDQHANHVI